MPCLQHSSCLIEHDEWGAVVGVLNNSRVNGNRTEERHIEVVGGTFATTCLEQVDGMSQWGQEKVLIFSIMPRMFRFNACELNALA